MDPPLAGSLRSLVGLPPSVHAGDPLWLQSGSRILAVPTQRQRTSRHCWSEPLVALQKVESTPRPALSDRPMVVHGAELCCGHFHLLLGRLHISLRPPGLFVDSLGFGCGERLLGVIRRAGRLASPRILAFRDPASGPVTPGCDLQTPDLDGGIERHNAEPSRIAFTRDG